MFLFFTERGECSDALHESDPDEDDDDGEQVLRGLADLGTVHEDVDDVEYGDNDQRNVDKPVEPVPAKQLDK